jgi:hypothetical protein
MMKFKNYSTMTALMGLMLLLVTYNHCGMNPDVMNKINKKAETGLTADNSNAPLPTGSNTPENSELPTTPAAPAQNPIVAQSVELGIKDYAMILENMASVTGVPASTASVQTVYNDVVTQLPSDNNVKSFLPSQQVAITKLAAEFCDALVENNTLRAAIWPTINFAAGPATALATASRRTVIAQATARFWGDGIIDAAMMTTYEGHLMQLFSDLLAGESTTSATVTRTAVKGVCLAILASSPAELL